LRQSAVLGGAHTRAQAFAAATFRPGHMAGMDCDRALRGGACCGGARRRGVRARGTTMLERSVGLKGLVFCAALVVLVPISVCGDAASARVANPG
jgi:hypothetical protein